MAVKPKLANRRTCTGCMACVDACPHGALKSYMGRDGHLYVRWNRTQCIGCNICSRTCPIVSGHEPAPGKSEIFAAWANDEALRMKSSSGGVFAALAVEILARGGVVFGAAMNGTVVVHRAIERIEDLEALQGSKYQQGDLSGVYRKAREYLREGRPVLFSGVPCQIAGLYGVLGGRRPDNLLTVDLVCGGFPSYWPMKAFLRHSIKPVNTIRSFRDKTSGWRSEGYRYALKIENTDGTESNYGSDNCVLLAFGSHMGNRYSCNDCKFARFHRMADLTIADLWGDTEYPEQHYRGLSAVIVHTIHGRNLLAKARLTTGPVNLLNSLKHNSRLVYGKCGVAGLRTIVHEFAARFFNGVFSPASPIALTGYRIVAGIYNRIEHILHRQAMAERIRSCVGNYSKKVALLTFHRSFNYGAVCQTYATCHVLRKLGCDVRLIDLRIREHYSFLQRLLGLIRTVRFARFRHRYYPALTHRYRSAAELRAQPPEADIYMTGSDQTWNTLITKDLAPAFWLDFGSLEKKRIGFSVSFGQDTWPVKDAAETARFRTLANRFDAVSVREKEGVGLCREIFGINAVQTLDPTLLMDNFDELTGPIVPRHHIASYKFLDSPAYYSCLKELGRVYGKPVELLGKLKPIRGFRYRYPQGIARWIESIAAADLVLTDSFHGVALSIVYRRNFVAFVGDRTRIGRIRSLLSQLGLEDRLYSGTQIDMRSVRLLCDTPIDYVAVEERLNRLKTVSIGFLREMTDRL